MEKINFVNNTTPAVNNANLNAVQDNAESSIENIPNNIMGINNYDNTQTYDVGDLVLYDELLYKCTTQISTAESWNSAHWTLINLINKPTSITLNGSYNNVSCTITAYKIEFGGFTIITCANAETSNATTSIGNIPFQLTLPLTTIFGGALNLSVGGDVVSYIEYCALETTLDAYVHKNAGSSQKAKVNMFVIGI